ncbi:universal stress protein and related nucleotide-binding proteins [Candidatus Scalindua japonica]|uniref:Universal stress protein and related nucleotide-binding proteins n=1 Tax=Candidatus Scalindua japonica TaxID=1284222 RepID=A0A286U2U6_9BACT|nr:universal stress protein and related nucleotide-binding proteins [Candidatus Scalindua japonica]
MILYKKIFIPLDNSKYSDFCEDIAISIAKKSNSELVGGHVYAASLHHKRFKEMEVGLPEKYKEESELKKQREYHNSLIGRGLRMISDSYLDSLERKSKEQSIPFKRNIKEGKNYIELVKDINNNDYDLVIIGVRGLGEVEGNAIGSVCERVVRRINTDVLIVKNKRPLSGRVIVTVDGSEQSFRAVEMASDLAVKNNLELEAVSVYDPHYHRVAFNGIAKILSGEMGEVFKSDEQEKLHEDVIDKGLEKIYQGHLESALNKVIKSGLQLKTTLLEGKPYDQILKYIEKVKPSLLVLGRTGIHAIDGLDLGSATENILRNANCNVLITKSRQKVETNPFYQDEEIVKREIMKEQAEEQAITTETVSWTEDANTLISKVPAFVRPMVVGEVENYARTKGSREITREIVEEVKSKWADSMNYS